MMEQPPSRKEENDEEMKSVSLEPDRKDPAPNHGPDPAPNPDGGAFKTGVDNADISISSNNIDKDLKEKSSGGAEESSVESAAEGLKTKKSVRWSQELVMESPVPRDSDRGSTNPYVNYSPAPEANSSSFNLKGQISSMHVGFDI